MKKQNNPNISEFKINYYLISIIGLTIFQIGLLMIYFFYIIYKYGEKDLTFSFVKVNKLIIIK